MLFRSVEKRDSLQIEALRGTERILFVDDEDLITEMSTELLASLGYTVTSTTDSMEALRLFKENTKAFDLLITDQTMPNMTGLDLAREVLKIEPDFPIILCTGYRAKVSEKKVIDSGIKSICHKPVSNRELALKIREVLRRESSSPKGMVT